MQLQGLRLTHIQSENLEMYNNIGSGILNELLRRENENGIWSEPR